jgi:alanine dehydrogenase
VAVTLGYAALEDALGMPEVIDLLERMLGHEAAGRTFASSKFNTDFEGGSMRILFAADYEAGYAATKAYNTGPGGVRYVVTLYRLSDGELLALLDGQLITDLRTGAASGVIARRVPVASPVTIGIVGSGHQARTQLESLASVYPVAEAMVYSPTAAHRERYAAEMSVRLGIRVIAVSSAEAAVLGRPVVVTASSTRSTEPVLRAQWLDACRLLCAVGNTRPQFAEADIDCFAGASLAVADTAHAFHEAGDLRRPIDLGLLPESRCATLAQLVSGSVALPREGRIVFKSVGSALQDLALAARYYELLGERAGIPAAADLAKARQPVSSR